MGAYAVESFIFDVHSDEREIESRLRRLLAPFEVSAPAEHRFVVRHARHPFRFEVRLDGTAVHRSERAAGVVDFILWKASTSAIDAIDDRLVVHAGAVSFDRRAIILPAPPDSGKTTLTAGLVWSGFRYLTDEAALIDVRTNRVHPFPRALWMEPASIEALQRVRPGRGAGASPSHEGQTVHVAPTDIRARSLGTSCAVGFVIFPTYTSGARSVLSPMSRAEALVGLANNAFNIERFGGDGIRVLGAVVAAARCYRFQVGDLGEAVDVVRDAVTTASVRA